MSLRSRAMDCVWTQQEIIRLGGFLNEVETESLHLDFLVGSTVRALCCSAFILVLLDYFGNFHEF